MGETISLHIPEHRVLILINKLINISIDIDFVCFLLI